MGFSLAMDQRMVVLTIPVDLLLEMESSVAETASVVRLARRGGKLEVGIVCLMKQTCQIRKRRRGWMGRELVPFALKIERMGMTNCSPRFFILI